MPETSSLKANPPFPSEREDGELSDAGQRSLSRQIPSGPRKRKLAPSNNEERLVSQRSSGYDGARINGHGHPRPNLASPASQRRVEPAHLQAPSPPVVTNHVSNKKEMVLPFMAALHREGFGFGEFIQEGLDPALLRALYSELQIPVMSAEDKKHAAGALPSNASVLVNAPSAVSATAGFAPAQAPPVHSKPVKTDTVKQLNPTVPKPAVPAAAAPVDRQSYLARLQAAKNKKASAPSPKPSAPTSAPGPTVVLVPDTIPSPAPAVTFASAPASISVSQPLPSAQSSSTSLPHHAASVKEQPANKTSDAATELVRKKMEALRSMKQRRFAPPPPTASPTPPLDSTTAQVHSNPAVDRPETMNVPPKLAHDATATAIPNLQSPVVIPPGLSAGGIPGLFMTTVSPNPISSGTQDSASVVPAISFPSSQNQQSVSRDVNIPSAPPPVQLPSPPAPQPNFKPPRPRVAVEPKAAFTPPEPPRYKRPFGRSRQNSSDEAMIIEVSDDEGTAGDDETGDADAVPSLRQKSVRDLPTIRDFPQRAAFGKTGAFQGTPTPLGTPGAASDAEELRRKEHEINTLQLKIQEFERRKKSLKAKVQSTESLSDTSSTLQRVPSDTNGIMSLLSAKMDQSLANPLDNGYETIGSTTPALPGLARTSVPGLVSTNGGAGPNKQSKLKADISASNAVLTQRRAQMMELQRQMAELQKQCEEEEQKKQELREELEALDINTEGMTHSEMQARKDEIVEQMQDTQSKDETEDMELDSNADPETVPEQTSDTAIGRLEEQSRKSLPEEGQLSQDSDLANVPVQDKGKAVLSDLSDRPYVGSQATTVDETPLPTRGSDQEISNDDDLSMAESADEDDSSPEVEIARLFVGNIPFSTSSEELSALFSDFDMYAVSHNSLPRLSRNTTDDLSSQSAELPLRGKKPTGFAFISLPLSQVAAAIERVSGTVLNGRKVIVQKARLKDAPVQATPPAPLPEVENPPADTSSSDDEMDTSDSSLDESDEEENAPEATKPIPAAPIEEQPSNEGTTVEEESDSSEMDLDSSDSDDESDYEPAAATDMPLSHEAYTEPQSAETVSESVADDLAPELQVDTRQQAMMEAAVRFSYG